MKQETLINVQQMNMSIIKEPGAQTINFRHPFYNVLMILLQMKISGKTPNRQFIYTSREAFFSKFDLFYTSAFP